MTIILSQTESLDNAVQPNNLSLLWTTATVSKWDFNSLLQSHYSIYSIYVNLESCFDHLLILTVIISDVAYKEISSELTNKPENNCEKVISYM